MPPQPRRTEYPASMNIALSAFLLLALIIPGFVFLNAYDRKENTAIERKPFDVSSATLQQQFKKILAERLNHPHVPSALLSSTDNLYKIKLRNAGYRLVYKVCDDKVIVTVLAIGRAGKKRSL